MKTRVEDAFHDVVDLSPEDRVRYFAEHGVGADTRREIEALAAFDSDPNTSLGRDIGRVADRVATHMEPKDLRCGPYQLINVLGRGGMGAVYFAVRVDGEVKQRVAVKLLRQGADTPQFRKRFLLERQILANLSHTGIASLLDAGHTEDGQPYLVMEYIDGTIIDVYAATLDIRGRLALFVRVCEAVSHAHQNLIVHRDIKPSNIIVDRTGEPKLLDFGIAKLLEVQGAAEDKTLTREDEGALTPQYAAPEQVSGGPVTTATDVYALGVLLYVLLTGQHPAGPGQHSYANLLKTIVDVEPPRVSDVVPVGKTSTERAKANRLRRQLRGDLDTILTKALKKNPQERYSSVAAFADDISRHLRHEPITARRDHLVYRVNRFVRRHRTAVTLAGIALVTSAAGVLGTLLEARTARAQRDFALHQLSRAEAMNDLNSFVLSDAAPSGRSFTVNELLGRAEHIVQRQRGEGGNNRVDLLISIGRQYYAQDEDAKSGHVLEEAYRLSRQLRVPSPRGQASCALASSYGRRGDFTRAEALIREGLDELPNQPQFVLDRVFCLQRGSEVARERGTSREAIARAQEAEFLLKQSPFESDLLEMHALMGLAESYRSAAQYSEADATFQKAYALLSAMGRDDTQTAGTLFNNWALALHLAGRPIDGERIYRRAIAISSSNTGEQSVSPMVLVNYSRVLRDLARFSEAASYAERGYAKAMQAGDQVVINQSLMMRGAIYRSTGDLSRAAAMLAEVEPRLRRSLPAGHPAFASLTSDKALLAQERGNLRLAMNLSNEALRIAEASHKAGGDGAHFIPMLLIRRSSLEVKLGRADDAAFDATRALTLLQGTPHGKFSGTLGRAYLSLAYALRAEGRRDEAQHNFASAAEHLENTLGLDHPETRSARELSHL